MAEVLTSQSRLYERSLSCHILQLFRILVPSGWVDQGLSGPEDAHVGLGTHLVSHVDFWE